MARDVFRKELERLINCESMENGSDTPDFMLADYLMACLETYEITIKCREHWYGRSINTKEVCNIPEEITEVV